jgi:hypothetical protein
MKRNPKLTPWLLVTALIAGCADAPEPESEAPVEGPRTVTVEQVDGSYRLLVDGEPFYVKGAGLERQPPGAGSIARLAEHGANALRTWRTEEAGRSGREILDEAHEHGLMVMMGLEIGRERPGQGLGIFDFDYDDPEAVAAQLERVRQEVLELKDHPALLGWGIGNELNLDATNPKVWDAVNGISEMIHEVDPHHVTTTMLAGIGPELVQQLRERAPDLDIVSVQSYADIINLPRYIEETGLERPYLVTEWGATGHWEVATTPWGAPIENTSSVKADFYLERYNEAIASDETQCLGSFVFLWGQKQERTPTWYGIFTDQGEKTESVDVMHYIWNGAWPENRTPRLETATLDGRTAYEGIDLEAGATYEASTDASDPDGDPLTYRWMVMRESTDLGHGGDQESVPEQLENLIEDAAAAQVTLTAPEQPGAYRLFVYVYDGHRSAAHANIPFRVR